MEEYGPKPEKFTKKWWENYWYYHTWHTLGAVFVAIFIVIGIYQMVTAPVYDLQVDYISEYGLSPEEIDGFTKVIQNGIDDITETGKNEINILTIDMLSAQNIQAVQATDSQFRLEMSFSDSYVFLMTKTYAELVSKFEILEPTSVWAGEHANEGVILSMENSKVLKDAGLKPRERELYIGVLKMRDKEAGKEIEKKRYQNGIKLANYLIVGE